MYPIRELNRLAANKAALRRDIALRRIQCAEAAAHVARPLEWLDRVVSFWRRLSPFAQLGALPLGWMLKRAIFPRLKILRSLFRWGPIVFAAVKAASSMMKHGFGSFARSADET